MLPTAHTGAGIPIAGLRHAHPSWALEYVDEIDSTNLELRRRFSGDAPARRVALVAGYQTQGRGRGGNRWHAPPGSALLATLGVPTDELPAPISFLPLRVGLVILEAMRGLVDGRAGLKWPNDLVVEGGKVGGILCETVGRMTLIGVGVNLLVPADALPVRPDGVPPARNLLPAGAGTAARDAAARAFLDPLLVELERPSPHEQVLQRCREVCLTLGGRVSFPVPGGGLASGHAIGLDTSGALIVEHPDGAQSLVTTLA